MDVIPEVQVIRHIQSENIWWRPPHQINALYSNYRRRAYFQLFFPLVEQLLVRRAILLMGPRRVGKTVLVHHAILELINKGVEPRQICYLSVDHPLYTGCGLEKLLEMFQRASEADLSKPTFIFFDEIQYLKGWEVHLKTLVDNYPRTKFIASGSSAAALKLKSTESGAGRFTDFLLPPLTFHEYLDLQKKNELIVSKMNQSFPSSSDLTTLNQEFIQYLNFGGYPEVALSPIIQADPARFVKNDIIDKVLLRDLPSLYGIDDIQELNQLFTALAFNTANEISLDELSTNSRGVAKSTLKRYIEYLEAAFLIKTVHRIDRTSKKFRRANFFKIYLMNPSMRSALFSPVEVDDPSIGHLVETGIFSQWFHSASSALYYARWKHGEVDIVNIDQAKQKPVWAVEVKWSDRSETDWSQFQAATKFCSVNGLEKILVTTKTKRAEVNCKGIKVELIPASIYCYTIGRNLVENKKNHDQPTEPTLF